MTETPASFATRCPHCGTHEPHEAAPRAGTFNVCSNCKRMSVVGSDQSLRTATDEERAIFYARIRG